MPKKIALDYDDSELRIVVANCNAGKVLITDAQVIAIPAGGSVSEKLRAYINRQGLQKTETLVAIGRGKAELRELQLPPVPADELPDMVRFQAIRSFASASERAIVDFLVTRTTSENYTLIAAAVAPADLDRVKELCSTSELIVKRVALRPLTAAALYLRSVKPPQICVLIDLLADDAEIVIARDGKVIFVRTVRLPAEDRNRSGAIAAELRRTMVACGETSTPDRIVVWGTLAVHRDDVEAIRTTIGCQDVQAVDPFDLVGLQIDRTALPEHVGRLAPLVGLLASDETAGETLIDFLNPRKRPEEKPEHLRRILLIAAPIAAVLLVGLFIYRQFANWDHKIAAVTSEVNGLMPAAEAAKKSIDRTEKIDLFLDGDVNWLDEIRRVAEKIPPSDQLIVRTITGTANLRDGGGTLQISGGVTEPGVIDQLEAALRDDSHGVVGKGSQEQKSQDAYNWTFTESISISGQSLRNIRYSRMAAQEESSADAVNTRPEPAPAAVSADDVADPPETSTPESESSTAKPSDSVSEPEPTVAPGPDSETEPQPAGDAVTPSPMIETKNETVEKTEVQA